MTYRCDDTRTALVRGDLPATREAQEHLERCSLCRELVADQALLGQRLATLGERRDDSSPESADSWQALEAKLAEEAGPTGWLRNRATLTRVAATVGVGVLLAVLALALNRRADWHVYPRERMVAEVAALLALLWISARRMLRPLQLPAERGVRHAAVASAFSLPVVLALLGPAHTAHPASLVGAAADFWPRALACLALGVVTALPLLLVLQLADRRQGQSFRLLALTAAAGGLTGNLVLHLHCPITGPLHLLAGHAPVGVALIPALFIVVWVRRRTATG